MNLAIPALRRHFSLGTMQSNGDPEVEILSFEIIIRDAELLLSYAATAGIPLNDNDVKVLAHAIQEYRTANKGDFNYSDTLLSYSRVAKQLLPITASAIRQSSLESVKTV